MIIKEEKLKKKKIFSINKFLFLYFSTTLIAGIILAVFILTSWSFQKTKNNFLDIFSKAGRYEYIYLPKIALEALKSNFFKINEINFEMQFEDVIAIENFRKNAIIKKDLGPSNLIPKVKANIIFEGKKYRGDVRLKGDRLVHFAEKDKSSYKIELDKNQYILGLKKFSIQKPRLRNYVHEWIFHEMAKDFNIIKIKYEFVNLNINGKDLGLYVIEEGFGKQLIEKNERRNGPIFSVNEDISGNINNPVFQIYNKKYWSKTENKSLARTASKKLNDFFNKQINIENTFDIEKWAAFFAVVDMTSTYHGTFLKSVRFYYNPINGLFEPIPFDGHRLKPNYHKYNLNYDDRILIDIITKPKHGDEFDLAWLKKFFFKEKELNQNFYNLYLKYLDVVSSKKYLDNFLKKNLKKIQKINSHIYADYFYYDNARNFGPGLYYFSLSDFFYQAKNIQEKLKIKSQIQVLKKNKTDFLIKNHYRNYGSLSIDKFICNENNQKVEININESIKNFTDTIVKLPINQSENLQCTHVNFVNRINKNQFILKIDYLNSNHSYKKFRNEDSELLDKYFEKRKKKLFLLSDKINIDQNLYIPKGFEVIIKPGQKLLLTNNAFIISNSPWTIGGKDKLTIISGEENNLGGGIYIGDTSGLSKIKNTEISYLTGYNINTNSEYLILGSINFNQTNVEVKDVYFKNIYSEDAINIFRSNFTIENVNYKNIFSDAIDIDFSKGEISSARFININNDAIDFSGSNVTVYDAYFNNVNDKLISAGEKSKINISKIKAINSHAGIISKDGSEVYSIDINFDGVKIPFAAYQKKKEYNHGTLFAKNFNINNFFTKWIKDKESNITINDLPIEAETKKVLQIVDEKKLYLLK